MQKNRKKLYVQIAVLVVLFVTILMVFLFCSAETMDTSSVLAKPSPSHLFGTDQLGRDVFVRTVHGFVYGFLVSFIIVMASYILGCLLGTLVGYYGGILDVIFYQVINFITAFPILILVITLVSAFKSGIGVVIGIMILTGSLYQARTTRNEVYTVKNSDYIYALKVIGAGDMHIVLRHLFPHALKLVFPLVVMLLGHIMLSVSAYSFLGFGLQPPRADIGMMLSESIRFIDKAPYLVLLPGLFQVFIILLLNRFSNTISVFADVRQAKMGREKNRAKNGAESDKGGMR